MPPTPEELAACPFCEGREERTPPETFAIRARGEPDSPGWNVRVVPNLYPALEQQEVVVHTPRHAGSLAELSEGELRFVAGAWHDRAGAARAAGFGYVHIALNEGAGAGASLSHSHSQVFWLREVPPAVAAELPQLRSPGCALCALAGDGEYLVAEDGGVALMSAPGARLPYEVIVAPRDHLPESCDGSALLERALILLGEAVRRIGAVVGPFAWNAWLHTGAHWHFELVPRLGELAGLELGAGIYVNAVAPERAAAVLRETGVSSAEGLRAGSP